MFVVDTNVLIYAANDEAPEHATCRRLLEGWRHQRGAWYLTWGVCYEFLRVITHPRALKRPWAAREACRFIAAVQASPGLTMLVPTEAHRELLEGIVAEVPRLGGNIIHDVTTAVLMKEHGVRTIYTRDTDFHRFPFLEVVDPLTLK
jgi:hypothetical protein